MIVADKKPIEEIIDTLKTSGIFSSWAATSALRSVKPEGKKKSDCWPRPCGCTFSSKATR
jgi:hypothetical protein